MGCGDASCWLDVAEFETHLRLAQSAEDTLDQLQHQEQAVAVYAGDLLPGCYSDWLLALHASRPLAMKYE